MNLKSKALFVTVVTALLVNGCHQRVEVASTPCDELGKTTDPKVQAELEEKCGRGGPAFKPTPKTREF
jgi:entry exclusion lipoprotein TrbK